MPQATNNDSVRKSVASVDSSFSSFISISRCMNLKEKKAHRFTISNSQTKDKAAEHWFTSPYFTVGGLNWSIKYYPQGDAESNGKSMGLFLMKSSPSDAMFAMFAFHLLNRSGKSAVSRTGMHKFVDPFPGCASGWPNFTERATLKNHIQNDNIVIDCEIAVYESISSEKASESPAVAVPPSEMLTVLGTLLESKEMADVTFLVDGETIMAHKLLLFARSPVFKALLHGPMSESTQKCITIDNMKASVFKVMLHYIYTDSLPNNTTEKIDNSSDEASSAMQHLMEAADRYGLDKLKLICEENLCKTLNINTVAATLALAHQNGCNKLEAACLAYMGGPKIFAKVALTSGFLHLLQSCPDIMLELQKFVNKME